MIAKAAFSGGERCPLVTLQLHKAEAFHDPWWTRVREGEGPPFTVVLVNGRQEGNENDNCAVHSLQLPTIKP